MRNAGMLATWLSCKLRKTGQGGCLSCSCPGCSHRQRPKGSAAEAGVAVGGGLMQREEAGER